MRVVLAIALLVAASPAAAETKSWAAIKGKVPGNAIGVVGFDAAAVQQSPSLQKLIAFGLAKNADVQAGVDAMKATCGIDVLTAVTDVTLVTGADDHGLVVVGLSGVDAAGALACMGKVAADKEAGATVSAKSKGKLVEYSFTGKTARKPRYVAWLAGDVIAFSEDGENKRQLEKLIGGKGARGDLKTALAKVSTAAPMWFAFAKTTPVSQIEGTLKSGWGTVNLPGSALDGKATMVMASAEEASKLSGMITMAVPLAIKQAEGQKNLTDLVEAMRTIKAVAAASEVTITGTISEAAIQSMAGMIGPMLGGP
jgi:hypothetical protein